MPDTPESKAHQKVLEEMVSAVEKMEEIHASFKAKIHHSEVA
jgi:hypothetical protein